MIIGIAVMLIAGLILAVGWWNEVNENKELKKEIAELNLSISKPLNPSNSTELKPDKEQGNFVRTRALRRASPETYRNLFDLHIDGQRVLDHLQITFANKSTYVRGGHDAERESCFRAGQTSVVNHIFNQINKANDPNYKGEVDE